MGLGLTGLGTFPALLASFKLGVIGGKAWVLPSIETGDAWVVGTTAAGEADGFVAGATAARLVDGLVVGSTAADVDDGLVIGGTAAGPGVGLVKSATAVGPGVGLVTGATAAGPGVGLVKGATVAGVGEVLVVVATVDGAAGLLAAMFSFWPKAGVKLGPLGTAAETGLPGMLDLIGGGAVVTEETLVKEVWVASVEFLLLMATDVGGALADVVVVVAATAVVTAVLVKLGRAP